MRITALLALSLTMLAPLGLAQKPPAPPPSGPPRTPPPTTGPTAPAPTNTNPIQQSGDRVVFLIGRLKTNDGSPLPNNAMVERICNNRVRQQIYASSGGDFSMELGSKADNFVDASGDMSTQSVANNRDTSMGIPRRELVNCELKASVNGFHSPLLSLVDLDNSGGRVDVGVIVLQRGAKPDGATLSAIPYKAPEEARKAYEKGMLALNKSNLPNARKSFELAVKIYPMYMSAWYQLGIVLQKQNELEDARNAFIRATTIDTRFLPPYLSLSTLAFEAGNWTDVLTLTEHILDHDPLNHGPISDYIVDLDPLSCTEAYFYNAFANFKLNNLEAAEKSGLKAEHFDLLTHFPQLHLLMGDIYARKSDYANAITEVKTYLALAPQAKNADHVRAQLAELEKLNASVSANQEHNHQ